MTKTQRLAFALAYQNIADATDADEIARYLELKGITGIPDQKEKCPLAEYFKWSVPNIAVRVDVGEIMVNFNVDPDDPWWFIHQANRDIAIVEPSESVSNFVERVDHDDYPKLDSRYYTDEWAQPDD